MHRASTALSPASEASRSLCGDARNKWTLQWQSYLRAVVFPCQRITSVSVTRSELLEFVYTTVDTQARLSLSISHVHWWWTEHLLLCHARGLSTSARLSPHFLLYTTWKFISFSDFQNNFIVPPIFTWVLFIFLLYLHWMQIDWKELLTILKKKENKNYVWYCAVRSKFNQIRSITSLHQQAEALSREIFPIKMDIFFLRTVWLVWRMFQWIQLQRVIPALGELRLTFQKMLFDISESLEWTE